MSFIIDQEPKSMPPESTFLPEKSDVIRLGDEVLRLSRDVQLINDRLTEIMETMEKLVDLRVEANKASRSRWRRLFEWMGP